MLDREIVELAARIAAGTGRDPFRAAREEDVFVSMASLNTLPGAYCTVRGVRILLLNERLPPDLRRVVCAHEMGHHFLHRERMPSLSRPHSGREDAYLCRAEREANLFAAEFLLSDEAVLPLLSAEGAAEALEVPPEVLLMKRIALGEKGMAVPCTEPPAGFLAGICR